MSNCIIQHKPCTQSTHLISLMSMLYSIMNVQDADVDAAEEAGLEMDDDDDDDFEMDDEEGAQVCVFECVCVLCV